VEKKIQIVIRVPRSKIESGRKRQD